MNPCRYDSLIYRQYLDRVFPLWERDILGAIFRFSADGDMRAMNSIVCICGTHCVRNIPWQDVAEAAALNGNLDMLQLIGSFYSLNWRNIEVIAKDNGHDEIVAYSSGTDMPISQDIFSWRDNPVGEGYFYRDYDIRQDNSLGSEEATEESNYPTLGSRPVDAFRNTSFSPYNLDGAVGEDDGERTI